MADTTEKIRLQKILAQEGFGSRRKSEELISLGEVTVNGKVAKLGDSADPIKDSIKVRGKLLRPNLKLEYFVFYKPKGVFSVWAHPEGEPCIQAYFPKESQRLFTVGQMDINSEGLLLVTNDGAMTQKLIKSNIPKIYHVKMKGFSDAELIKRLSRGCRVQEQFVRPLSVRKIQSLEKKTLLEFVFLGDKKVDLKSYCDQHRLLVEKICRVGLGQLRLKTLQAGKFRPVLKSQLVALIEQPELGLKQWELEKEKTERKELRIHSKRRITLSRGGAAR